MSSDVPRLRAGIFELSGISGVSLAAGADVLGIRMVGIDPSIGMLDGKDLPLSLAAPVVGAPDLSYFLRSASRWTGFTFRGRRVNAEAGPARTAVSIKGAWDFESEPGISVQEFQETPAGIQFVTATDRPATIRFSSVIPLPHISVNGVPVEATAASGVFQVPPGISRVEIRSS